MLLVFISLPLSTVDVAAADEQTKNGLQADMALYQTAQENFDALGQGDPKR